MKKLFQQIIKFGLVGALCFVIDFLITMGVSALARKTGVGLKEAAMIGGFFGFVISVIVNYILSMKFVFERKEDMDRKKEFIIFLVLSVIGLGINEIIIKLGVELSERYLLKLTQSYPNIITAGAKVIATAVVMIYNFVTRKIFLEKKNVSQGETR